METRLMQTSAAYFDGQRPVRRDVELEPLVAPAARKRVTRLRAALSTSPRAPVIPIVETA